MGFLDRFSSKAKDPVCGMDVQKGKAADTATHGGKTYHFCSKACAAKFRSNPGNYV